MKTNALTARRRAARLLTAGFRRGVLAAVAAAGLTGTAAGQAPGGRAAVFLPPQPLGPGETAPVARGAAPDDPAARPFNRAGGPAPAWLGQPSGGVVPAGGPILPAARPGPGPGPAAPVVTTVDPGKPDEATVRPQMRNGTNPLKTVGRAMRNFFLGDPAEPPPPPVLMTRAPVPALSMQPLTPATPARVAPAVPVAAAPVAAVRPAPTPIPAPVMVVAPKEPPTSSTPFVATGAGGGQVYAGPPAYRWYGYGTTTPGANPYAPNGQYPRASANWYATTKATPGAFPVPVNANGPVLPGSEPPGYATARASASLPTYSLAPAGQLWPAPAATPPAPAPLPPVVAVTPAPQLLPPAPPKPAAPVGVPALPPAPAGMAAKPAVEHPAPAPVVVKSAAEIPPRELSLKVPPPAPRPKAEPELKWQAAPEKPGMGTWVPAAATDAPAARVAPAGDPADLGWKPADAPTPALIARGQVADPAPQPDPVAALIRGVCRSRAAGVEVRWTGSRRLSVCFEAATEADAKGLVKDLSDRPELGPYQIDFCVLVK